MISKIPEKFSKVQHIIEKLYIDNDTFRSIYKDYQTYLDALQFWSNPTRMMPLLAGLNMHSLSVSWRKR